MKIASLPRVLAGALIDHDTPVKGRDDNCYVERLPPYSASPIPAKIIARASA